MKQNIKVAGRKTKTTCCKTERQNLAIIICVYNTMIYFLLLKCLSRADFFINFVEKPCSDMILLPKAIASQFRLHTAFSFKSFLFMRLPLCIWTKWITGRCWLKLLLSSWPLILRPFLCIDLHREWVSLTFPFQSLISLHISSPPCLSQHGLSMCCSFLLCVDKKFTSNSVVKSVSFHVALLYDII